MIDVSFVVGIEQELLEQILQLCFQNLNTVQAQSANLAIQQTPNK